MEGGEHPLKILGPWLLWLKGSLKIFRKRVTDIKKIINQLVTKLMVEQLGYTKYVNNVQNTDHPNIKKILIGNVMYNFYFTNFFATKQLLLILRFCF